MKIKSTRMTYEIESTTPEEVYLKGSIAVVDNFITDINFQLSNKEGKTASFYKNYFEDNRSQENISGEDTFLSAAKSLVDTTINEFKTQYIIK